MHIVHASTRNMHGHKLKLKTHFDDIPFKTINLYQNIINFRWQENKEYHDNSAGGGVIPPRGGA